MYLFLDLDLFLYIIIREKLQKIQKCKVWYLKNVNEKRNDSF